VHDLEQEAALAWPAVPARRAAYRGWLRNADELAAELPRHQAALADLRAQAVSSADAFVFANDETQWWHDTLEGMVAQLERFTDPDPFVGAVASVRARLVLVAELEQRSLLDASAEWDGAIAALRDPARSPAYGGLEIARQFGLVPLTQDPDSGLWEFAHLASGPPAEVDAEGRTHLRADSGVVLVLVPGGVYPAGAQVEDPTAAFYDPLALHRERTLQEARLDPYFISKFELTRRQWKCATGHDPSVYVEAEGPGTHGVGGANPVENVSWAEAAEACRRLGFALPTEVQWEVAARGGSEDAWWTGREHDALQGAANLADIHAKGNRRILDAGVRSDDVGVRPARALDGAGD
jgi:hypothetical protein